LVLEVLASGWIVTGTWIGEVGVWDFNVPLSWE